MKPVDYAAAVEASFDLDVYKETFSPDYFQEFKRAVISSEVFALPKGGRLFPVSAEELEKFSETRLPYPFTALAYDIDESFYLEHAGEVYMDGLWYSREKIFGPGASQDKQFDSPNRLVVFSQHEQDGKINTKVFQAYTCPAFRGGWHLCPVALSFLSESYDLDGASYTLLCGVSDLTEENKQGIVADAADEITILQNLLLALSCTNVSAEKVSPGPVKRQMLRKKRLKAREHWELFVRPSFSERKNRAGSHAPPRQHLRRGHIRNLPNGNRTWVSPCVVGSEENGVVTKTYKVGGSDK